MQRIPEPELMDDADQAWAYAHADFDAPHNEIIDHFARVFGDDHIDGEVLDLGCGPADVTVRFALRYSRCRIDGVDGAPAMLAHGRQRIERAELNDRVRLLTFVLPTDELPRAHYATVISNSLLHHLHDPMVLWAAIKQAAVPAARIFVADLMRPVDAQAAGATVARYAADEPRILQRDFCNSLCAAFTLDEVSAQLATAGLDNLKVEAIDDRHLIAWGRCG